MRSSKFLVPALVFAASVAYDAPALAALLVPALQGYRLLYVARRDRRGARREHPPG